MQKHLLQYKRSQISYYRFGRGTRLVLCFHGFGEAGDNYAFLEKYAGDEFIFYSIELPFHGDTNWNEGLNFTHTDLQQIIHEILLENNHGSFRDANFRISIMGFSLGGRVALSLYQAWPEAVDKLVLLAPDGLKVNFWYWMATQTKVGKGLFAFTMKHPGWFFGYLRIMDKIGLVNASVYKFVNFYIGDEEARIKLYQRWTSLRRLKPNLKRIKSFIRQNKTQVRLVYGKHDRIILSTRGEQFRQGIEDYCTLNLIESGHQVLHEKHAAEIVKSLTV